MSIMDDGVRNVRRFTALPVLHDGKRVMIFLPLRRLESDTGTPVSAIVANIDPWIAAEATEAEIALMAELLKQAHRAYAVGEWTPEP